MPNVNDAQDVMFQSSGKPLLTAKAHLDGCQNMTSKLLNGSFFQ